MSDLGQLRRATGWLSKHGLAETGPTPLLTARLAVRRRARVELFALAAVVFVLAVIAQFLAWYRQESGPRTVLLVSYVAVVLAFVLLRWLWLRAVRRADRRIGAGLTRRVAHPTPPRWQCVLGRGRLITTVVTYAAGGFLLVATAVITSNTQHRVVIAIGLTGLALLAATSGMELTDIMRRPALAEDALSLVVDDTLRAEDAREAAAAVMPAMLVAFTMTSLDSRTSFGLVGLGFLVVLFAVIADAHLSTPVLAANARTQ
jgi:hypothetical protein